MGIDLAGRVQAGAGVVQVDVLAFIEAAVFGAPQLRQGSVGVEIREPVVEVGLGGSDASWFVDDPGADSRGFSCCALVTRRIGMAGAP